MTMLHALLLGLLQGFTEFFPVSSSGHLVLAENVLGLSFEPLDLQRLNVLLHTGTLFALLLCYRTVCIKIVRSPKLLIPFVVASIPAAVVGLLYEERIANAFHTSTAVAAMLAVTGVILLLGERLSRVSIQKKDGQKKLSGVFAMGCAQACALVPGLSRSGLTISAGRLVGLSRGDALDFTFLMGIPVFAGATLLVVVDDGESVLTALPPGVTFIALLASFGSSIFAILVLRRFVKRHSLALFTPYLFALAGLIFFSPFFS